MTKAPIAPAGWYPDPDEPSQHRFWNGARWTDDRRPATLASRLGGTDAAGHNPRPQSPVRRWLAGLSLASWIAVILLGGLVLIGVSAGGIGGMLMNAGLIALVTGAYSLVTGRRSWAHVGGRKVAAIVVAGGLVATMLGANAYGATRPDPDPPLADASPAATASDSSAPAAEPRKATPSATPVADVEPDAPDVVRAGSDEASVVITDASVTQTTALALLDTLPVKGRAPKTGYDRTTKFGTAWLDVDRNGCDTRNDILARDLEPDVKSGPCKVLSGTLADPYTGKTINFVRGNTTSLEVQIDHVVALMNAWETGAQQLTQAQRVSLANDPLNLLAVDGPTNLRKGAGDAATWLPPQKSFRCAYVARQVSVKATYGLWVTQAEHDAIARILASCPNEPAVTSAFAPAAPVVAAPEPAPEPAPAPPVAAPDPAPAPAPPPAPAPVVYYENCTAVRAAGAAPIHVGDPGYSRKLDRDGDGIGCE
jgi:hypothetical protein